MEVICLQSEAFYELVETVVNRVKQDMQGHTLDKWIDDKEAMRMLRITSKTTLSVLRDGGDIRFSQPRKKIILYDRDSINIYLDKHAKDTF